MKDWNKQAQALNRFIRPLSFPIGIKLVQSVEDFPEKTRRPLADLGFKTTICISIAMTRKYGWTVGMTPEDSMCPVADLLYGWNETGKKIEPNLFAFLKSMNYGTNDSAIEAMLQSAKQFQLDSGQYAGIVFSPLELGRVDPDMVMIFCNSAQVMRLVHAATREDGVELPSIFTGRFGSCNEGVLQTIKTGQPKIVLPGNGDRVWGMVQDDEFIFTIPAGRIDQIIEGLEATHQAGVRYPIPVDIRHIPNFPPQLLADDEQPA